MAFNDISKFKTFIKKFILEDLDLQKMIYYPYSSPLDKEDLENPYNIFDSTTAVKSDGTGAHGVVLFRRKCDEIINVEIPIVLVTFESTNKSNSKEFNNLYIIFRIICKGQNIQELSNGDNRIEKIAEFIDNNFNYARVNNLGKTKQSSYSELSLNEENDGITLMYRANSFNCDWSSNKNFQKRIMHKE